MTKHRTSSFIVVGSALLVAGAVAAQEGTLPPRTPTPPAATGPVLKPLDRLLNATVFVPGKATDAEGAAGKRDNLGIVSNLVIDTQTQRITFAAVHTEDGARAVPFTSLIWDPTSQAWMLGGKDDLMKAKAFEPQRLDSLHGAGSDLAGHKSDSKGDHKGDKKSTGGTEGGTEGGDDASKALKASPADSGRYALATDCAKREVAASDGRFASAVGMVVEARTGTLAFLRVAASGGDVAVPWSALQMKKGASPRDPQSYTVAMTKDRLEAAPRLDKDATANLDDRAFRSKLYEYFGVPSPAFEAAAAPAPRK